MDKFKSRISEIIDRLHVEGNVVDLSDEVTAAIENEIASTLKVVKSDFELKERKSRAYISDIELASLSK